MTSTDKEFMMTPIEWPRWPILPIKRYPKKDEGPECSVIIAAHEHRWRVYHTNLFMIADSMPKAKTWAEMLQRFEFTDYDSVDDLLKDGWIVD